MDVLLFGKSYDDESCGFCSQPLSLQTTVLHIGMRTSDLINGGSLGWPRDCFMEPRRGCYTTASIRKVTPL